MKIMLEIIRVVIGLLPLIWGSSLILWNTKRMFEKTLYFSSIVMFLIGYIHCFYVTLNLF